MLFWILSCDKLRRGSETKLNLFSFRIQIPSRVKKIYLVPQKQVSSNAHHGFQWLTDVFSSSLLSPRVLSSCPWKSFLPRVSISVFIHKCFLTKSIPNVESALLDWPIRLPKSGWRQRRQNPSESLRAFASVRWAVKIVCSLVLIN